MQGSSARKEYSVEYSRSGRATCKRCYRLIDGGELRAGHAVRSDYHDGYDTSYYHFDCVYSIPSLNSVAGWERLRWADQLCVRKKVNDKTDLTTEVWVRRKADNDHLWKLIDKLADVPTPVLKEMLVANGLSIEDAKGKKKNPDDVTYEAAEGMLFGLQAPCTDCKAQGLMSLDGDLWKCNGWLTAYTRCQWTGTDVQRQEWLIPAALVKKASILGSWKRPPEIASRPLLPRTGSGGNVPAAAGGATPAAAAAAAPLEEFWPNELIPNGEELGGLTIAFVGTHPKTAAELEAYVTEHGGTFSKDVPRKGEVHVLIATEDEIAKAAKKRTKKTQNAVKWDVPILKYEWLENLAERKAEGLKLRTKEEASKYALEGDVTEDFPQVLKTSKRKGLENSGTIPPAAAEEAPAAKKKRRVPVDGEILKVDPESGKAGTGKVYVDDDIAYHAMLTQTDIATLKGVNKFYRIQVIKHKDKSIWWAFCHWGRIGTSSGDYRIYEKRSASTAIEFFEQKFRELTGNDWAARDNFKKLPGRYSMVELEGNEILEESTALVPAAAGSSIPRPIARAEAQQSSLPQAVQEFVKLIFDANMMKKTMEGMNMDTAKMPLGKLSRRTINEGFAVLTELQDLLKAPDAGSSRAQALISDASNRFYHLIPHSFGHSLPPVISTLAMVKQKTDMLTSLMDMEAAAALMKSNEGAAALSGRNEIDVNYESLGIRLIPIAKDSATFEIITRYVKNTHAATHSNYGLRVDEAFEVEKDVLSERFKKHEALHNHQLLWHGSRLSNWVGILSQGLRIAPPEAPVTGYMFGKGVYFADMVSKSANYCFTDPKAPTGILLLSEIALGNYYERTQAEYVCALPNGTHSCKGIGQTFPNPTEYETLFEKVRVPLGLPTKDAAVKSSLLYNEFIVYDTAQILPRFLLRTSFIYK